MKTKSLITLSLIALFAMSCKKEGCTNPQAINYNPEAKKDNGTCVLSQFSGASIDLTGTEEADRVLVNQSDDPNFADYFIDGTWEIDAAITVEPGVRIEMRSGADINITVNGSLNATGTASANIEIFGKQPTSGYWENITFESNNLNNKLIYCVISDGSEEWDEPGMVTLRGSAQLIMQHTTLSNGSVSGLQLKNADCKLPNFQSNYIDGMSFEPIYLNNLNQAKYLDATTTFGTNNTLNQIKIEGENYSVATTVPDMNIPYYINSSFSIDAGHTAIDAGVTFIMAANVSIVVNASSSLSFNGNSSKNITIKGEQPTKGFWAGIEYLSNNLNNVFSYTNISDGTQSDWDTDATIYIKNSGQLAMDNCHISNCSQVALNKDSGATFTDNGGNSWSDCDGGGGLLP